MARITYLQSTDPFMSGKVKASELPN